MTVTKYVWDPVEDNVIEEYDENGNTVVEYATEPDLYGNLISQDRGGTKSYYHYDGQGSTLALTDENGDVTDTYAYNAFGETTEQNGSTQNSRRYVGEKGYEYDMAPHGYYVRTRCLEPSLIRWRSKDPLHFADIYNLYRYVGASPVNRIDPSGYIKRTYEVFDMTVQEGRSKDTIISTIDIELTVDTHLCERKPVRRIACCSGNAKVTVSFTWTAKLEWYTNTLGEGKGNREDRDFHTLGWFDGKAKPLQWKGDVKETGERVAKGSTLSVAFDADFISCDGGKTSDTMFITGAARNEARIREDAEANEVTLKQFLRQRAYFVISFEAEMEPQPPVRLPAPIHCGIVKKEAISLGIGTGQRAAWTGAEGRIDAMIREKRE